MWINYSKQKHICISAIIVSASWITFKEIIQDKEGRWNPCYIHVLKKINDVIAVKGELK